MIELIFILGLIFILVRTVHPCLFSDAHLPSLARHFPRVCVSCDFQVHLQFALLWLEMVGVVDFG